MFYSTDLTFVYNQHYTHQGLNHSYNSDYKTHSSHYTKIEQLSRLSLFFEFYSHNIYSKAAPLFFGK